MSYVPAAKAIEKVQSPWIPILKDHAEDLVNAVRQKNIELQIFCGACDEDCLPMAKQLYEITNRKAQNITWISKTAYLR